MARRLRYEREDGLYHVINRGNYRQPVFGTVGAAQAFETALWETLRQYGWRLHGYVLMNNHFHLALETPHPNLAEGMHRLQSAFATRFNRFRSERGHLFQGRYQALMVEDTAALARVVDYIHLNPVRAKLIESDQLAGFRWSSLRRFLRGDCPEGLTDDLVLPYLGLPTGTAGWAIYLQRLGDLAKEEAGQQDLTGLSQGWAIGTAGWKAALAKELGTRSLAGLGQDEAKAVRETSWQAVLDEMLVKQGKTAADLPRMKPRQRGEQWRLELAKSLRARGASHRWIAQQLGFPSNHSLRVRLHLHKS
jgi:REP element-mobilizing transposase RayT